LLINSDVNHLSAVFFKLNSKYLYSLDFIGNQTLRKFFLGFFVKLFLPNATIFNIFAYNHLINSISLFEKGK